MRTDWSDADLMAIFAILQIENLMEPICKECGYGSDRPNCAMSLGGCPRHTQEDVIAYHKTINSIMERAGLNSREKMMWRTEYPLHLVWTLSDTEKSLMLDLLEVHNNGGKQKSRSYDKRWGSLYKKGVVYGSFSDYYYVEFTKRGLEWAKMIEKEELDGRR